MRTLQESFQQSSKLKTDRSGQRALTKATGYLCSSGEEGSGSGQFWRRKMAGSNSQNGTGSVKSVPHDEDFVSFSLTAHSTNGNNSSDENNTHDNHEQLQHNPQCFTSVITNDENDDLQQSTLVRIEEPTPPPPPPKMNVELLHDDNHVTTQQHTKNFVTPQDFQLLKVIGMGSFGKVLQVRSKHSQQILAMKVISKRLLNKKISYIDNIHAERDILTKVRHPFVVNMHCSFQTREKLFIIMDFLAGGELFLRLGREGVFLESTARFYIAEIILALEHLHSKGVLHRDLKPENILLGSDGHICLTDFGLAKDFSRRNLQKEGLTGAMEADQQHRSNRTEDDNNNNDDDDERALTICGTQEYMAPEMIARKGYGKAADFWSLGCIFYEMLQGNPPFQSKAGAKDLFRKIMSERVRMPAHASANACKVLKGLMNRNATARLGAAKGTMFQTGGVAGLKQEELFHGIDWMKLERKEIEPPERFLVDGADDLRYFYDEFTQMSLPRSVKEMSADLNPPRRCRSDMFKGFSFIQDDFALPDRPDTEKYFYWSHIEEDGESASESASSLSKTEDEANLHPASTSENCPDKKRNRKKKKNILNQTPSANPYSTEAKLNLSTEQTADQTAGQSHEPSAKSTAEPNINLPSIEHTSNQMLGQSDAPSTDSTTEPKIISLSQGQASEKITVNSRISNSSSTAPGAQKSVDNTNTEVDEWETVVKPGKKSYQASRSRDTDRPLSISNEHGRASTLSTSHPKTKLSSSESPYIQVDGSRRQPTFGGNVTAQSPNDWREHKMRTPTKTTQNNSNPSPADATKWPGLGDQSQVQSAKDGTSNFSPKGAWASRTQIR